MTAPPALRRLGARLALAAALLSVSAIRPATAEEDRAPIAFRVELHQVPTLTLPDSAFLTGDAAAGQPATVTGELRIAQGQGRLPVVVLMHGSGGIGPNIEMWSRLLNAQGISTFAIDGFTGRGIVSVSADQARLGRLNFILDIYRSLELLAKHPRVDPDRILLMGFSRGGQAAYYAAMDRFHRLWNRAGAGFAAYLAFYPDCATRYEGDTALVARPVRLFHGEADDYNPLRSCAAQVARQREAGRDVAIATYPGAHHGFDTPLTDAHAPSPPAQTVRDCAIEERTPGQLVNAATGAPFAYTDACVAKGPHVGGHPAAREAARRDVMQAILAAVRKG